VRNFFRNAVKYAGDNGDGYSGQIDISVVTEENSTVITFADHGNGNAVLHNEQIFQDGFTTARMRRKGDVGRGKGLGLSVARQLVALNEGTISVDYTDPTAEEGSKGSKFTVTFPHPTQQTE
jgi:signal transduction histidine kinase